MSKPSFLPLVICLLLAVATFAVYGQALENDFVYYDDYDYVVQNEHIQKGFTRDSIRWAFGAHASNWHPLTWLSHMLDYRLFGLDPEGHHRSGVLIHLANTALLFFLLRLMTGALWRSAFVAALFGMHPLHVESVAWVAERKDVLSTLFWILTTWAYVWYAKRPSLRRYFLVVLCFLLGLMAKPMLVTLPFALLLLDFWPLGRTRWAGAKSSAKPISQLLWEKLPLFVLTALSCALTLSAQGRAVSLLDFDTRIANALVSYATYLMKTVWPVNLAVFYPHLIEALPMWKVAGAGVLLVGVTVAVVRQWRNLPYLAVGWFWYLGTLLPVIGVVQVGAQAMADRYTYIPLIGLFIIVSWGMADLADRWRMPKFASALFAGAAIFSLMTVAWFQVGYWRNTGSLFEHAIKSVPGNYLAHVQLGVFLENAGNPEEAASHFAEAVRIKPDYTEAYFNLGNALSHLGKREEAVANYSLAVQIKPIHWRAYFNMGAALFEDGEFDEAVASYLKVLEINPGSMKAHNNLGAVFITQGKYKEAVHYLFEAIKIKPGFADAHHNLGVALVKLGKVKQAADAFANALSLQPDFAPSLHAAEDLRRRTLVTSLRQK